MRLARIGPPGAERPAVHAPDGTWRDLSAVVTDITATGLAGDLVARAREAMATGSLPPLTPGARFGPPVAGVGKIVCVGLNYRDHAGANGTRARTVRPSTRLDRGSSRPMRSRNRRLWGCGCASTASSCRTARRRR